MKDQYIHFLMFLDTKRYLYILLLYIIEGNKTKRWKKMEDKEEGCPIGSIEEIVKWEKLERNWEINE